MSAGSEESRKELVQVKGYVRDNQRGAVRSMENNERRGMCVPRRASCSFVVIPYKK
jgi:hypothetical protein